MELTLFYTWSCLILSIVMSKISFSSAKPTFIAESPYEYESYGYDAAPVHRVDHSKDYVLTYGQPLTPQHLSRLRRGYYYVDDGYIAPVSNNLAVDSTRKGGNRRQDADGDDGDSLPDGVRFTPLVRYKQTRTNRKKLFVPNLFG